MKMKHYAAILLATIVGFLSISPFSFIYADEEETGTLNNHIPAVQKAIGPGERYWLMSQACYHGDVIGVQMLLNAGAEPDGVKDYKEFQRFEPIWHLSRAASGGHLEVIELLLKSGATVDLPSGEGYTALFMAVISNRLEIVKRLLQAGANPSLFVNGRTMMELAKEKGFKEIVKLLESQTKSSTNGQ